MIRYKLKINASPETIKGYNGNYDIIKTSFIPQALDDAFESKKANVYLLNNQLAEVKNDSLYKRLDEITNKIEMMYEEIYLRFLNKGELFYPKEYIDLVAEAKRDRRLIISRYPALKRALRLPDSIAISNLDIQTNGRVGTGIDHLQKMSKIRFFLQGSNCDDGLGIVKFSYHRETEMLSLEIQKNRVYEEAKAIEARLNNSISKKRRATESIHINPVFKRVVLKNNIDEQKRRDWTLIIDYPNGETDLEYEALVGSLEKTGARSAEIKYKNADREGIEGIIQKIASNGYLYDVRRGTDSAIDVRRSEFETLS
ncbi:hypothetical protein IJH46_01260 [Candidatus Saccharibacteria bacterium]|nr:hypothetical protein [Candidatus Saccharibacteria bacterium]